MSFDDLIDGNLSPQRRVAPRCEKCTCPTCADGQCAADAFYAVGIHCDYNLKDFYTSTARFAITWNCTNAKGLLTEIEIATKQMLNKKS